MVPSHNDITKQKMMHYMLHKSAKRWKMFKQHYIDTIKLIKKRKIKFSKAAKNDKKV